MLSTIKNDPDWEDQIEIKYENIPEYIDIKEIKEESAECQEFKIKIEMCSVDEGSEDLLQECIKGDEDCSDNKFLNSSIGILDTKDTMVAHNTENECSVYQNTPSSKLVSLTSNASEIILKNNVNRKRNRVKIYKCKHCDFEIADISAFTHHINSIHKTKKIYQCEYCDYGSHWMSALTHHINSIHARDNIHKCEYCNYGSPLLSNLKSHINSKHPRDSIIYSIFTSENTLKTNINMEGKRLNVDNGNCLLNLKSHIRIHKCGYCDYGSPHIHALKIHINSKHTREKIHKCEYCEYECTQKSHLKSHINSKHTREKMHKCQYCDYESSQKSNLKCHIKSKHTREKIHQCQCCNYGSTALSTLKNHINSKHSKNKLHTWECCDYESPQKSHFKNHINPILTRKKIHKCEYCDYESPQKSNLRRHTNSKHKKADP